MHPILKSGIRGLTALGVAALMTACASGPIATVEDRVVTQESNGQPPLGDTANPPYGRAQGDTATPLEDRRYQIEQAEYYRNLADSGNSSEGSVDATLSAAEFYIQANDTRRAEASITNLSPSQLNSLQQNRYQVILAYIDYSQGSYNIALDRIYALFGRMQLRQQEDQDSEFSAPLPNPNKVNQQRVDALLLASFCHQALGEYDLAITNLVEREALLYGASRAETTRYIWQVINSLDIEQRRAVIDSTSNAVVRNRFEQSLQGQVGASVQQPRQFDQWQRPAPTTQKNVLDDQWAASSPRSIAILLPLSSRFNKAAQAVLDGIEYQHSLNESIYKPRINVYDIGDSPWQIMQFYSAAQQNGADLIIGPLGKEYANQMAVSNQSGASIPTILLGGDQRLSPNSARLTISPEHQGRLVSQRAMARGYVNAAVLVPDTSNGQRIAEAFSEHWLEHGGKLSKTVYYSPRQFDHSTELKQLFDINQSEYRHSKLSTTLGFKPKFAAYRRTDIDFIFMIADNKSGRILRPQINFFSGATVPVIAPSSIYNGIADATNNVDLDDTSFPVMPWVLLSNEVAPYAGQLNMLFAMGSDAYQLTAGFRKMRNDPSLALQGNMGVLNIEPSGEVNSQPVWASFKAGLAESEQPLTPISRPPLQPNLNSPDGGRQYQQGTKSYNESNWDRRQSRRKTGG